MNLNDLANLGQIIGALAVVISLIYVALSIRQNTNAIRAATAQSVHEHYASWYNSFAGDETLSGIAIKGLKDYGSLSEIEKARFVALSRSGAPRQSRFFENTEHSTIRERESGDYRDHVPEQSWIDIGQSGRSVGGRHLYSLADDCVRDHVQ